MEVTEEMKVMEVRKTMVVATEGEVDSYGDHIYFYGHFG